MRGHRILAAGKARIFPLAFIKTALHIEHARFGLFLEGNSGLFWLENQFSDHNFLNCSLKAKSKS